MHAASREALDTLVPALSQKINDSNDPAIAGSAVGTELFEVVAVLDQDRTLRTVLSDNAMTTQQRSELIRDLFVSQLGSEALEVLTSAVSQTWSNSRDMRQGLVELGNISLLTAAQSQGNIGQVEDELFELARLLEDNPEFEQRLADKTRPSSDRRELLAKVLKGKVLPVTEGLALQVVTRPVIRPVEDLDGLCELAASRQGTRMAKVTSATELSAQQKESLASKLEKIYGTPMSVHTIEDPALIGGVKVAVGFETIDGSISGKLDKLRAALV